MVENKADSEIKHDSTGHHKEEEMSIDLSKVKDKFKGWFGSKKKENVPSSHKEEELSLDLSKLGVTLKNNVKWLIPLACILIAVFASVYLRTMPERLPITDDWAQNTVFNYYKNNVATQINQQYPNLPDTNKNVLIEKEWQKFYDQNKDKLNNDIVQVSKQYKDQFKDDQSTLYLLGIDPWHYYRQSSYALENGYPGNTLKDGQPWDTYRLYPVGVDTNMDFHTWAGVFVYKLFNLFGNFPLMYTFFFVGVIFSALCVIPAFFIGKRLTGNNIGGFFTALLLAVTAFFVQRTTGESSDTDVYVVLFPLLVTWMFLEAFEAKELKKKLAWITGAGITTGIFSFAWGGWWYIFDFILATLVIYFAYILGKEYFKNKKIDSLVKQPTFKHNLLIFGAYILISGVFVSLFMGWHTFTDAPTAPFDFLKMKAVAEASVKGVWPNIYTTVAELNVPPLSQVIEQLGGKLIFALALVGIFLVFWKKDQKGERDICLPIFLIIWFAASLYATSKGVRFILQATPVVAIAFGAFLGIVWHYVSNWVSKELNITKIITQVAVFILLAILLIQPVKAGYDQAYNSVPSINDGWYQTLSKINNEAPKEAVITSWWDFGYWFRAIANRPVTFDGGTQKGYDAHWVGRSLLTSDEQETAGILMMLNCGQNNAAEELDQIINDTPKTIALIHKLLLQDKEEVIKTLTDQGLDQDQITTFIKYFHCDAAPDYYITSDDMIGKAGVWGHFGSWDFQKAQMYQETKDLTRSQAISLLTSRYGLSETEADQLHYQIQNTPADQFVASWPGYLSGLNECSGTAPLLTCNIQTEQGVIAISVDLNEHNATIKTNKEMVHPTSLVYADKEGVKEQKYSGNTLAFSVVLVPKDQYGEGFSAMITEPSLAASTFTKLFFFEGHGQKCFSKFDEVRLFTGGKVSVWKVDYECNQKNQVFFLPKEEVNAAHILISTQKRSEAEALQLAQEIKKNLSTSNFAEYAQKYSDDGSASGGGDLGWFKRGVMVKPFEAAAFSLAKGQISDPIKTDFGYHLILVKDKRAS